MSEIGSEDPRVHDLAEQNEVRLPLPIIQGSKEYRQRKQLVERMDELLQQSGAEAFFVGKLIAQARTELAALGKELTDKHQYALQRYYHRALRCTIARILSGESLRSFSCHLAESHILRWFCHYDQIGVVRIAAKSTIQRMEEDIPRELIEMTVRRLLASAAECDDDGTSLLGLAEAVDLSTVRMDSTCAKLDMHFPADWTLLRDGVRSIMRSIAVIRSHGLRHRLPNPESLVSQMNRLAIAMSGASRKGQGSHKRKERKAVLRGSGLSYSG